MLSFTALVRDSKYKPWMLASVQTNCFELIVGKHKIFLDDIDTIKISKTRNALHVSTFYNKSYWIRLPSLDEAVELKFYLDRLVVQPLLALQQSSDLIKYKK